MVIPQFLEMNIEVSINGGTPKCMINVLENHITMEDLVVLPSMETSIERIFWFPQVMLESAGRACPDKDQLARDCSEPAMEVRESIDQNSCIVVLVVDPMAGKITG